MEHATHESHSLTPVIKRKDREDAKGANIQQNFFTAETQRVLFFCRGGFSREQILV